MIEQQKKALKNIINNNSVVFIFFASIGIIWFGCFRNQVIMGDDLGITSFFSQNINPLKLMFGYFGGNKYRPILSIVQYCQYRVFGSNYQCYFWFNVLVHTFNAYLIYHIVKRVTKNFGFSIVAAVCFITSIYSYYNITQLFGVMESMCLLFLLLVIIMLISFYSTQKSKYLYYSLAFSFLLIFTHERYIVLFGVYCVFLIFCDSLKPKKKIIYLLISAIPFLVNYLFKIIVLGAIFFEGTGGNQIKVDFRQILIFIKQSVLSILGINTGANYLHGYVYDNFLLRDKIFAFILFGLIGITLSAFVYFNIFREKNKSNKFRQFYILLVSLAFAGALIVSYSITVRVEMRWIYSPYIVFVLFFMYALHKIKIKKIIVNIIFVLFCALSLITNYNYRQNTGEIYFNRAFFMANSVYNNTVKRYGEEISNYKLYFIYQNELQWAVGGNNLYLINQYLD